MIFSEDVNLWCITKKTGTQNLQTGTLNPKQELCILNMKW